MPDVILVINSGSSSIKFQIFEVTQRLEVLVKGRVTGLGSEPKFKIEGQAEYALGPETGQKQALEEILSWIAQHDQQWNLVAAGHRIVHGGKDFRQPVMITAEVLDALSALCCLAPLHMPHNLSAVKAVQKRYPSLKQVACFDTGFHATLAPLHYQYALSRELREEGIRKYGFHGLSYEWIAHSLKKSHPDLVAGNLIAAHLGNGASLCAMQGGQSVDTTMGLTALEGLPMGTRCGSLDPGAVIYLFREMGWSADEIDCKLSRRSGLLGLSGISHDVRDLRQSSDPNAAFAIDFFALKVAQHAASLVISLGNLDGFVFSGGIGENNAAIRQKILTHLQCFAPFEVQLIEANEEKMIAEHVLQFL